MALNYELNTAFRWYLNNSRNGNAATALQKKHNNRPQASKEWFKLYSHDYSMPPFMFLIPNSEINITTDTFTVDIWRIVKSTVADPLGALNPGDYFDVIAECAATPPTYPYFLAVTAVADKGIYAIGCYGTLDGTATGEQRHFPFEMGCGFWYSVIKFHDGTVAVSEDFYVPKSEDVFDSMLRIDWRNTKDLFNVLYGNYPTFSNRIYLETDLVENEQTTIEEGFTNAQGKFVQQALTILDNYNLTDFLPEYLLRAIKEAMAVDTLIAWPRGALYWAYLKVREIKNEWSETQIDGLVHVSFQQDDTQLVKSGCGSNLVLGSPFPLTAVDDHLYVYPKNGVVDKSVLDNDTGLGKIAQFTVAQTVGPLTFNMRSDGKMDITGHTGTGFMGIFGLAAAPYTVYDSFGNSATAQLFVRSDDWYPTDDTFSVPRLAVLIAGVRLFNFGIVSLLDNDVYPINANDVEVLGTIFFSLVSGTGNYVFVQSDGRFEYHIINPTLNDVFLISYYNNDTATVKQAYLYINIH